MRFMGSLRHRLGSVQVAFDPPGRPGHGGTEHQRRTPPSAAVSGKTRRWGSGLAAKLQESITGPHLAPQPVDVEFSFHGLTPPIAICSTVYAGTGQPLDSSWNAEAKPRTHSDAAQSGDRGSSVPLFTAPHAGQEPDPRRRHQATTEVRQRSSARRPVRNDVGTMDLDLSGRRLSAAVVHELQHGNRRGGPRHQRARGAEIRTCSSGWGLAGGLHSLAR